jgi:hypothetical protein
MVDGGETNDVDGAERKGRRGLGKWHMVSG